MKSTKLALAIVLLCGTLSACKQEASAPAAEATPPAAAEPVATTPEPMPADAMPADDAEDGDSPHTGGDRIGTGGGQATGEETNTADDAAGADPEG